MDNLPKYLYSIIRCSEERTFNDVAPIGDPGGRVYTIPHQGIAVVVSDALADRYEGSRANMLAHERVQEGVLKEFTLLPVRFGTVADSESPREKIEKLLEKRSREINGLLAEMDGKVELGLKALWRDEKAIFEEILAQNEDIRRLRDSLAGKSSQATHFDRIRLGESVKNALDRKKVVDATNILAPLRRIARRVVENQVFGDRMVANAAFLVDRDREGEFDQQVRRLDEEMGRRIAFKYVGPVPPYNFVNIVVNWREL